MKTIITLFALIGTLLVSAQSVQHVLPPPTIDVTGEGIVRVIPDEVTISVRVENTGRNVKDVKQANDIIVANVLSFLKQMKIEDKDVKTEYIQLNKNYDYNTKTYNYAANQSISVKIRDIKKYETIMNGLLESGINRIDGVVFSASNNDQLESEARKKAVSHAKMKAEEYAGVLSQTVGKAVSISEYSASNNPGPMYKSMAMQADSGGAESTIAPGELVITVTVNLSFLLH